MHTQTGGLQADHHAPFYSTRLTSLLPDAAVRITAPMSNKVSVHKGAKMPASVGSQATQQQSSHLQGGEHCKVNLGLVVVLGPLGLILAQALWGLGALQHTDHHAVNQSCSK